MGQDIKVSARMRSQKREIALEVDSRAHSAIESSGIKFKEGIENAFCEFSRNFPGEEFAVETASSKDFEPDYEFKARLKNGEYFNILQNYTPSDAWDDEKEGDEITFEYLNAYEFHKNSYITMFKYKNSDLIYYSGLSKNEVKLLMELLQQEFSLDYVTSNEINQVLVKDTWEKFSSLPTEVQQMLGVKYEFVLEEIPEQIRRVLNTLPYYLGGEPDNKKYFGIDKKIVAEIENKKIDANKFCIYSKNGEKYIFCSDEYYPKLAYAVAWGVIDLSEYKYSDKNEFFQQKYEKWLEENNYSRMREYAGIGCRKIEYFNLYI